MPNTKTAKKELRKNIRRRASNKSKMSALKTAVKKCRLSFASGDADQAFLHAQKKLAKAAGKGLIPAGRADRLISNLNKRLNMVKSASG